MAWVRQFAQRAKRTIRQYRWLLLSGVVVVAAAITAALLWWPDEDRPAPRAREYLDYDVCLLTGARGLTDAAASAVWAGLQQVSAVRGVRVLYVAVAGEQTTPRAGEFLASLVAAECEVIVAVGEAPVAAVAADKGKYPGVTIIAVGQEIDASSDGRTTSSTVDVLLDLVPGP